MNRQVQTWKGESDKAKNQREIENNLDKALLKQREAEHVKVRLKIIIKLYRNVTP